MSDEKPLWGQGVLLVENTLICLKVTQHVLTLAGARVHSAQDGRAGWMEFNQHGPFDWVLLDVDMPLMNGVELCEKIWAESFNPQLKILAYTAYTPHELEQRYPNHRFTGLLGKPFSLEALLRFR